MNQSLLAPIRRALGPRGIAVFAGMELAEAPLFRTPLVDQGFRPEGEIVDDNWWAVAARPA